MALSDDACRGAAQLLLECRRRRDVISALPLDMQPTDEDSAYRIQKYVVEALLAQHGPRIGYKIGATNPPSRAALRLGQSFYGSMFAALATPAEASRFRADEMTLRVCEPEIAIELGEDLAHGPYDAEAVRAATAQVLPAFEILGSAFGSMWKEVGGFSLIADNGAHGCWVYGRGVPPMPTDVMKTVQVTLTVNGKVERQGTAENVDDSPYGKVAWFANYLLSSGSGVLRKGDRISTGTLTPPWSASAGDTLVATFEGIGSVEASFF